MSTQHKVLSVLSTKSTNISETQATALQILRTSNEISTWEKLAAVVENPAIPKFCALQESERISWLGQQMAALNYMAHYAKPITEIDLLIDAKMLDTTIMEHGKFRNLTQIEMQEAFRCGVTRQYGDFYGISPVSMISFLKGFITSEKYRKAEAVISKRRLAVEKEARERFWKEMYDQRVIQGLASPPFRHMPFETCCSGKSELNLSPSHRIRQTDAEDREAHLQMIREQQRLIYAKYGKEGS